MLHLVRPACTIQFHERQAGPHEGRPSRLHDLPLPCAQPNLHGRALGALLVESQGGVYAVHGVHRPLVIILITAVAWHKRPPGSRKLRRPAAKTLGHCAGAIHVGYQPVCPASVASTACGRQLPGNTIGRQTRLARHRTLCIARPRRSLCRIACWTAREARTRVALARRLQAVCTSGGIMGRRAARAARRRGDADCIRQIALLHLAGSRRCNDA
jgi:hypothetical protein